MTYGEFLPLAYCATALKPLPDQCTYLPTCLGADASGEVIQGPGLFFAREAIPAV